MLNRTLVSVLVLLGVACADSAASEPSDPAAARAAAPAAPAAAAPAATEAAPAATGGAVSGTVRYRGTVAPRAKVDLSPDPFCVEHHGAEGLSDPDGIAVGADDGLADVFVEITGVPEADHEAPATPVVLDQVGCTYVPHVFGVMVKQDIEIRNSDATLHNIHPTPARNKEFNLAMPNKGDVRTKDFRKAEEAIPFKCDVHPWMKAFCFVMEHPYFGSTDKDGKVSIDTTGLPDGEYGVKLWHETLGTQEGKVKVAGGSATFELGFGAEG